MDTSKKSSLPLNATDPIIAPVTPAGYSSIAGVRLSGDGIIKIMESVASCRLPNRQATLVSFPELDQIVVVAYPRPASYTGEDVVECFCHGSPVIVDMLLDFFLKRGFRLAEPGEFTLRAVVNGKMDLIQAEAVHSIIHASSPVMIPQTWRSLSGELSEKINRLKTILLNLLMLIQAYIEFPEDGLEIDRDMIQSSLRDSIEILETILRHSFLGDASDMPTIVITGPPNTGKSTLFNALLGQDRSIISPQAGTTRDHVGETMVLRGIKVLLYDTAGLRETKDEIEKEGVNRTLNLLGRAHGIIYVIDGEHCSDQSMTEWSELSCERRLLLWNKLDLDPPPEGLTKPFLAVSALEKTNMDLLRTCLEEWVDSIRGSLEAFDYLLNQRQYRALETMKVEMDQGIRLVDSGGGEEEIEFHLRAGIDAAGSLLGDLSPQEVLDQIFKNFCIGK